MVNEEIGFLSVTQCAERHGVTRAAIHAAIKSGRLAATRVGSAYLVSKRAAEAYQPLKDYAEMGRRSGEIRRRDRAARRDPRPHQGLT